MRNALRACAALLLATLAGCSTIIVDSGYDKSVDFSHVGSWAWDANVETKAGPIDGLVRESLAAGLKARGVEMAEPAETADLHVSFHVTVEHHEAMSYTQPSYEYSRGSGSGPYWGKGGPGGHTWSYEEGTLLVQMADGKTGHVVWHGSARQVVDPQRTEAERRAMVHEAVTRMLADFPPGR